jgi:hypothetical protein
MLEKVLSWIGNVVLASVLVLLSSQHVVFAQDGDTQATQSTVNGGDEPGRIVVPLTGTAHVLSVNGLAVSPSSFDTGVVQIGESTTQTVTLSHVGELDDAPIVIESADLFGASYDEYQTDFVGFVTLNPGESVDFDVTFTPLVPGTKSAGLRMDVEGASAPQVVLFNGWSRYPLTSDLSVSDNDLKFGQINTGKTVVKNLVFENLGETDAPVINVTQFDYSGDTPNAFTSNFTPFTLNPGQTKSVAITMSGAQEGTKNAILTASHDGNNEAVESVLSGTVITPSSIPANFTKSSLANANIKRGTSAQFGPDDKLYVAEMDGYIEVYTITRNGKNNYSASLTETINLIANVQNHNDDGSKNNSLKKRLLTGILVTGTAANPIIYAASSDPRQAAGPSGFDSNLDTNSGILHKLTKNGGNWSKQDLVRGLPRSEENHVANGLILHNGKILLNMGGHTNMGVPSNNFAEIAEYALSAAILEIDIASIGNSTYDLPTLNDEDRAGVNDANDPFGGNNGKNQAKLIPNSPVKLYATGFRNAYDIVKTLSGKIYTFDNGPNPGWGGWPNANCENNIDNGGAHHWDGLHLVTKGFYGGHPNPTRGNLSNTFNASNPQTPIEGPANPEECVYKQSGNGDGSLTIVKDSVNGLTEYTASNFGGSLQGELLAASYTKQEILRIKLNGAGTAVTSKSVLMGGVGKVPLDVTAQGDNDVFPGTIWVIDNIANSITVLEPSDY